MPSIRVVFLWHMHQPFYKDLVTGEYRLPWVRLHALKDYYGMVKLLDEFPGVHQTFNLVPSLIAQLQDYVSGTARDPFLELAAKPAPDLTPGERRFALEYLFQANPVHMIRRYPRYEELWNMFRAAGGNADRALPRFQVQDFTDLQVLSQLVWYDEFFLDDPGVAALIRKQRGYSEDDQRFVVQKQREFVGMVLPAYAAAAAKGAIEISTSPFYHPILPLLCDTDEGAVSTPGLKLPQARFRHPEDARMQLARGLDLHERTFGVRPRGAWPSEGSVSEEVLGIAYELGVRWMATDEGVLGRTLGYNFVRDGSGRLHGDGADKLYRVYRYDKGFAHINLLFRDHALSDLIGFVYSGMPAQDAAANFIERIKASAQPVLDRGRDAVVPIILDGENAWEYYPGNGREFLRRLYDGLQRDPRLRAVTVSEAVQSEAEADLPKTRTSVAASKAPNSPAAKATKSPKSIPRYPEPPIIRSDDPMKDWLDRRHFARLQRIVPGSWIHANFNVWIGAPEDNRAWDHLSAARDFYANHGMTATEQQRTLALEELLIAEGSDWNWWYGPEHHTANDRDFDELYRKHLSNVYLALGARPPDYLAQPIAADTARPTFIPQTAYIHPRIGAGFERYFDWIGAAMYTADRRAGAMHGKQFLLDSVYAGIDETHLYGRLDFATLPDAFELVVNMEPRDSDSPGRSGRAVAGGSAGLQPADSVARKKGALAPDTTALRLEVSVADHGIAGWNLRADRSLIASAERPRDIELALRRNFVFKLPLQVVNGDAGSTVRLRFSLWRDNLPVDALPVEGWLELAVVPEHELEANIYAGQ